MYKHLKTFYFRVAKFDNVWYSRACWDGEWHPIPESRLEQCRKLLAAEGLTS